MAHNVVVSRILWQMRMYSKYAQRPRHSNAKPRIMENELRRQRMLWQNAEKKSHSRHDNTCQFNSCVLIMHIVNAG